MPFVTVRYYAVLREQRGLNDEQIEVRPGTTIGTLYTSLFPPTPEGALPVAYVRNHERTAPDAVLEDGDDVVFLPPLGGG